MGPHWGEWGGNRICVSFVLLAYGTALNIFRHILYKTWPPELRGNKLVSLKVSGVSSSLMIMTVGEDGAPEGVCQGKIDISLVY